MRDSEDVLDRNLLDQLLGQDFVSFAHRCFQTVAPESQYQHNWHLEVMAERLESCHRGKTRRLIMTLPPRHLKSIYASVVLPAWVLGHDPSARIICASYASELAAKHARDCRAIMEAAWYRRIFPRTRLDRKKITETEFTTTRRGFRLATSVGGTLTGRGGDYIIVDDPLKADEAMSESRRKTANNWFTHTPLTRLDDKKEGRVIVVIQRLHVDDLVGCLLEGGGEWEHLSLPAIAANDEQFKLETGEVVGRRVGEALHPERESLETLAQIKRDLGSHGFSAQYLQDPVPADGELIKWHWFRFFDTPPDRQPEDLLTLSFDTASKAEEIHDYTVCTVWLRHGTEQFLLEVLRRRLDFPGLKRFVVEVCQRYQPDAVLIEDSGSGTQLIQELRYEGSVCPISVTPYGDKVTRMYSQTAKLEAGAVLLPRDAPWLEEFRREVLQFPNGRHDDQVDSMAQYLGWRGATPMIALELPKPPANFEERAQLISSDPDYLDFYKMP